MGKLYIQQHLSPLVDPNTIFQTVTRKYKLWI